MDYKVYAKISAALAVAVDLRLGSMAEGDGVAAVARGHAADLPVPALAGLKESALQGGPRGSAVVHSGREDGPGPHPAVPAEEDELEGGGAHVHAAEEGRP